MGQEEQDKGNTEKQVPNPEGVVFPNILHFSCLKGVGIGGRIQSSDSQSTSPIPAAWPGNLLEKQIPGPPARSPESEALRWDSDTCALTEYLGLPRWLTG